MELHFLGANRQVTGSCYVLEAGGLRVMIDCGLFQERAYQDRNWAEPAFPPDSIDHVLLTHAHLDHCGMLPRLVAHGYRGSVTTVEPSVDLAKIIMVDSAGIQVEDAAYKKRRHKREGRRGPYPEVPLYTVADAKTAARRLHGVRYGQPVRLNDQVSATFHDAGHILGSAMIELVVTEDGRTRRLVFSGDVGQWDMPLMNDPHPAPNGADYVVMESTYGDRLHGGSGGVEDELTRVINQTVQRGGNVVIPTFAMERAQVLLYAIGQLVRADRIPDLPVYLDSPMAVDVTEVFHRYCGYLDEESRCRYGGRVDSLTFPGLRLVRRRRESIAINNRRGPCVIMASSGMCTGGRIKHHLRNNITRPEATVLFVGYQAEGTLGRQIVEGRREVRIHGRTWPVRAQIDKIDGLSAHGDRDDLMRWLGGCERAPRRLFLTHGEEQASRSLAGTVRERLGWPVTVPAYRDVAVLD